MSITKRFKRNLLKTLIVSNKDCNIIVKHQLNIGFTFFRR